jgi:hypothetical protein
MSNPTLTSWFSRAALVAACIFLGACTQTTTGGPQCRLDRDCGINQTCTSGSCVDKQVCTSDAQCTEEQRCDVLTGTCLFRSGFGTECGPNNNNTPCAVGQFCALGRCRDTSTATLCSRRLQCAVGQVCDRNSFYCIEEAPCSLATDPDRPYPELSCDPGDRCDPVTGACVADGPPQCDPTAMPTGCALDELCNGARRCVQCISNQDCGPGLRCNTRAGLCESTNTCRSNADCRAPLVCDRATALCAVPLPPCTSDLQCQLGQFCDRVTGTCALKDGKCEEDRFEENDTSVDARNVDLSNAVATVNDLMLCANDADVYSVDLALGDELRVVLGGTRPQAQAEIWALAPDAQGGGLRTVRYAEAPPRGNGTVAFVAQRDGRYFIKVISIASQSAYNLTFTRTLGMACMADQYDVAPNNNNVPFSAGGLSAGLSPPLTLCQGDEDWYLPRGSNGFSLRAGQAITVALSGPVDQDFDLLLTDVLGSRVLARSEGPTAEELLRYRVTTDQDVLVAVKPYGPSTGSYTLNVTLENAFMCVADMFESFVHAGGGPVDAGMDDAAVEDASVEDAAVDMDGGAEDAAAVPDAAGEDAAVPDAGLEDAAVVDGSAPDAATTAPDGGAMRVGNNRREDAIVVGLDGLTANLSICLGDEDWFVVEARAHQRVLATARWASGEPGVTLEAYDNLGVLLGSSTGPTSAALSVLGNAAGQVLVRVVSPASQSPYALDIHVERATECLPDRAEPNNTPALAASPSFATDGVYTLCGTDVDLFRVEAGAGKRLKVDVDFSLADGDVDLAVLLPDGVTTLAVSDGVTAHESLDVVLPADPPDGGFGAYFISVFAGRSDTRAPYRLRTQILSN